MTDCLLECPKCEDTFPCVPIKYLCEKCKLPLLIKYNHSRISPLELRNYYDSCNDLSVWRYLDFLPLRFKHHFLSTIDRTPLLEIQKSGRRLFLKDDTRLPSLSHKDRASFVVLAYAIEHGHKNVICASTGNAAVALARMSVGSGVQVHVIVPKTISHSKLALLAAFNAQIYRINGSYDQAYELSALVSNELGFLNRNTAYNPLTREGKKTAAFEICEQMHWSAPDWVAVPIGDGNIISGIWKGFLEFYEVGLISRLPRLLGVQAKGSNAILRSLLDFKSKRFSSTIVPVRPSTVAHSISVALPSDGHHACAAIVDSNGIIMEFEDEALINGVHELSKQTGLFCEMSSAASYVGASEAIKNNHIKEGESVVCLITGHGIKESNELGSFLKTNDLDTMYEPRLKDIIHECRHFM